MICKYLEDHERYYISFELKEILEKIQLLFLKLINYQKFITIYYSGRPLSNRAI